MDGVDYDDIYDSDGVCGDNFDHTYDEPEEEDGCLWYYCRECGAEWYEEIDD